MFVLDTDTVSLLQEGNSNIIRHMTQYRGVEEVATTVISRIKVFQGRFAYLLKADTTEQFLKAQRLLMRSQQQFDDLPQLMLDEESLRAFQDLRKTKGIRRIGRPDLLIAAISLARQATLVTRNRKHFELVPNLRIVNWVDG